MNLFELFVKIGVDDQASGNLKNISEKLGNGLKTAAKVGTAAVGVASSAITALTTQAVNSFAEYEQLAGGAQKIFDQMDYSKIATDANNAYKELGLSANQYLAVINDVGATFAATMGDEAGYEAAKTGLKAISDYASGTGKNVDELSQKFTLITRSTSSYQSIADQFSGILPATSSAFLEQAQAAGILSDSYKSLTEVPIDEYQAAVSKMLEQGVEDLGLANNTMNEAFSTLSGSLSMAKGAWNNLVTGLADDSADLDMLIGNFVESVSAVATQLIPKVGNALNSVGDLISNLAPVAVDAVSGLISDVFPSLLESGAMLVSAIGEGIVSNADMLIQTAFDVILMLADGLIAGVDGLSNGAISIVESLAMWIVEYSYILIQKAAILITEFVNGIVESLPVLATAAVEIISSLASEVERNFPELIKTASNAIMWIVDTLTDEKSLGSLLDSALVIIMTLADGLIESLPDLIEKAPKIVQNLVDAIIDNAPKLLESALILVLKLAEGILSNLPELVTSGIEMVSSIIEGIVELFGDLVMKGKDIVDSVKKGFSGKVAEAKTWGKDLIQNFIDGITAKWNALKEKISSVAQTVKDYIGFSEPKKGPLSNFHTYAPDMMELFAKGIRDNEGMLRNQISKSFDFSVAPINVGTFSGSNYNRSTTKSSWNGDVDGVGNSPMTIIVQSVLDGKVIGETAYQYSKNKGRMYGMA